MLAALATQAAAAPATIRLRFLPMTVPAGGNVEACYFIRVTLKAPFDLGSSEISHRGIRGRFGNRHFLVYLYQGDDLAAWAKDTRQIVTSRGCQELGPADRDHRQLIARGSAVRNLNLFPPGVALPLVPSGGGVGILLDAEWVNDDTRAHTGSSVLTLRRIKKTKLRRRLAPIFARTAERALLVPPGTVRSTEQSTAAAGGSPDAWGPGLVTDGAPAPAGAACAVWVTGHTRKRGTYFTIDHLATDGTIQNPPGGLRDPFDPSRPPHLFASPDFTDPGAFAVESAMPIGAGEKLAYACRQDNGASNAVRQGCAEVDDPAGTPPGRIGRPAKPCRASDASSPDCPSTDTQYPGRTFTGECRDANLVAGPTPDDETCALTGFYYDAAPGGGCDVGGLPRLP